MHGEQSSHGWRSGVQAHPRAKAVPMDEFPAETSGLSSQFRMTSVKLWREVHRRVQWWCDAKEPCKGPQRENR